MRAPPQTPTLCLTTSYIRECTIPWETSSLSCLWRVLPPSSSRRRQYHPPNSQVENVICYWGSSCRGRVLAAYVPKPSLPDAVAARDHRSDIHQSHSDSSTHQAHHSNHVWYISLPCGSDANGRGGRTLQGHDRDDVSHGMVRSLMCELVKHKVGVCGGALT